MTLPIRLLLIACGLSSPAAWAQSTSSIAQVTLYPGSAKIERVAKVAAGARQLVFSCLPATLDVPSLAVSADAPLRLGELAVITEAREAVPACSGTPLDARIRELEDRKA